METDKAAGPLFSKLPFVQTMRWLFWLALTISLWLTDHFLLPVLGPELWRVLLALGLVNGVTTWLCRRCPGWRGWGVAGLLFDILALTLVVAFSGGVMNPVASLYLFPLLIAALTCRARVAWLLVAVATACYLSLFRWYRPLTADGHPHQGAGEPLFNLHLVGMWLTFGLSAVLITAAVSWLIRRLADKERQLRQAYQNQQQQERFLLLGMESASVAHQLSTPLNNLFLLAEELEQEPALSAEGKAHLDTLQRQLLLCRDVLWQLKHRAEAPAGPVWLFDSLRGYLARWNNLRPDVHCQWYDEGLRQDYRVWLDEPFWAALLNILDNAADAGENRVELYTTVIDGRLLDIGIHNRQGHLSEEQLRRAGLNQQESAKPAGLGMGVWLAHATFSRLDGSLTLRNHAEGGVYARIRLPLRLAGEGSPCPVSTGGADAAFSAGG
ncbi:sensor histidine kinase [Zobellella taiwanensis]|uniref:histidine kinase n=1 Tax=Zobellella taiwanensis TaxID=347535 RepID=A0A2P7R4D3_9GAMM|nr:HAMP domain-containing histidine kinase [Zobellella taiwanensis]PSJ45082.1 sensor histidine kinase [Zobellella taiwanensis]